MTDNLFNEVPERMPDELVKVLAERDSVRIERIISDGHTSPAGFWYHQDEHEWVMVVSGSAVLEFEDRLLEMGPGDYVLIPAHQKHRVASTASNEKTIWLAVFF